MLRYRLFLALMLTLCCFVVVRVSAQDRPNESFDRLPLALDRYDVERLPRSTSASAPTAEPSGLPASANVVGERVHLPVLFR